ncbi:hypothetical protein AKJ63_01180 [candidate division MSBL1 archaeon SCGC-AAA259D18]|uniref:MoaB/Mog domain-containing protein n=1 Tax=candidate division MSBL1 archaeon SCGC-AAA259D18 TaxID=1698262 RepID=A0A133UBR7_9EURY|nr:hypothetical protein AKJ63_01180 [candidate division MSBL1 archaeon SCGC-AAA259D18]
MIPSEHKENAPTDLHVGIITTSDSLYSIEDDKRDDKSGNIIQERIDEAGFSSERYLCPDEGKQIRKKLLELLTDSGVDAVITTGGTGVASRDITIDVVSDLFDKELPGFGELLRRKSYGKIGNSIILTRATAGLIDQKPVFCLPGSPDSVKIGSDLIVSELAHIEKHARE